MYILPLLTELNNSARHSAQQLKYVLRLCLLTWDTSPTPRGTSLGYELGLGLGRLDLGLGLDNIIMMIYIYLRTRL